MAGAHRQTVRRRRPGLGQHGRREDRGPRRRLVQPSQGLFGRRGEAPRGVAPRERLAQRQAGQACRVLGRCEGEAELEEGVR